MLVPKKNPFKQTAFLQQFTAYTTRSNVINLRGCLRNHIRPSLAGTKQSAV